MHQENPEEYTAFLESRKVQEKNRRANGGEPKAKGETRKMGGKNLYPTFFNTMLTKAAGHFVRLYGQPFLFWNHIVLLFDAFLVREQFHEEMKNFVKHTPKGSIRYIDSAYREAVAPFLTKVASSQKKWQVIDATGLEKSGKKVQVIIEEVLLLIYKS